MNVLEKHESWRLNVKHPNKGKFVFISVYIEIQIADKYK